MGTLMTLMTQMPQIVWDCVGLSGPFAFYLLPSSVPLRLCGCVSHHRNGIRAASC
jgi:hypothetical protein